MPNVGRPALSFAEFIAEIQTIFYGLIADLTTRVDVLENTQEQTSISQPSIVYVSTGSKTNPANYPQEDSLNISPSFGSSTIPGGTLQVGSTIVINVIGFDSTSSEETLGLILWGSPEPPIISCSTQLAAGFGGAISLTINMTMRETTAFVNGIIVNGANVTSSFNEVSFDRSIDCPLILMSSWSGVEDGGSLTIESRTIEIKHPPPV